MQSLQRSLSAPPAQVHAGASSWGDDSAEVEFSLTQQVIFSPLQHPPSLPSSLGKGAST